jgi:NAD(P)-dependent dehydrogenase (short-subunit alcohol dehydrogenase family)
MTLPDEPGSTMRGKTCLVTGATSGIGVVTAGSLARRGASLILVGRDQGRCDEAVERIRRESGNPAVEAVVADLSVQDEVRRLAAEVREKHPRLDVLVNNAGAMFAPRVESRDGIEMTWALDHLAYFLLTNLLLDTLKVSAPSRIVNVASDAHRMAQGINFDDPEGKTRYKPFQAYAQSKLANILFTYELARRLEGSGVTANTLHPGFVATRFAEKKGALFTAMKLLARVMAISPDAGARTTVYLAASPEVEGVSGKYYVKEKPAVSSRASHDAEAARRLWRLSAQMTGSG